MSTQIRKPPRTRRRRVWPLPFQFWFPLVVYGISRMVAAGYLLASVSIADRSGYADLATAWDGDWYRLIATEGYPSSLPLDVDGEVAPNAWAFLPVYPLLVRALMFVTGLDFSMVAPTLSLALGALAMVVIFVLMERAVGRFSACATVLLSCTFMAAPVLQIGYTESLALLLVAGALLLLRERRYLPVACVLLVLSLTRPVVLAFAPVVMAHATSRWRARESDPFPGRHRWAVVLLTCWSVVATGLWPLIVGVRNKDPLAWLKTHEAWRTTPASAPAPGLGWLSGFLQSHGWLALAALTIIVVLTLGIVLRPEARAWGPELRTWSIAYPGFLLLTTVPGASAIRWLVLAFPLMWPFPEVARSAAERRFQMIFIAGMALVGLTTQWVWVSTFLAARAPSVWLP